MNPVALLASSVALALAPTFVNADAAAGERVFRKCQACHQVGEDAKNRSGPTLNGIVGAAFGSVEDFRYSDALLEKRDEGMVWDEATLDGYLENPKKFLPGGKMAFAGLRKEEDRTNVIAYLRQFSN